MNTLLGEAINSHIFNLKDNLKTSIPCEIVEINLLNGEDLIESVSIKPVTDRLYSDGLIVESEVITNVPLLFPSNSKGTLSYPVSVGDYVVALFSQADIQKWLATGKRGVPQTFRKFSLTDAVAIPCIHPTNSDIKAHKDNFQITFNDFKLSVKPSGETSIETSTSVSTNAQNLIQSTTERYTVDSSITEVTSDTVTIGNGSVDIVQYLSDLTDEISNITVGGTPIDNKDKFTELKALIDELK